MTNHGDTNKIDVAVQHLQNAKSVVILTGAGLSKASGLPTYRDPQDGIWTQYDPRTLATVKGFEADPKRGWTWHEHWQHMIRQAKPNAGHFAIAEMERLLPMVRVVTQNIDGLHQAAGSINVLELHGSVYRHKCFADCRGKPTLLKESDWIMRDGIPHCPYCDSWVRPDTVWFEELVPDIVYQQAIAWVDTAAVFMTIGTSGVVMPAANFPYRAKRWNDAFVIDINPNIEEITAYADLHLAASASEVLPLLVKALVAAPLLD